MSQSLQQRIYHHINQTIPAPDSWMVWCDPQNHWGSLLLKAAEGQPGFNLLSVAEQTAGELGGPLRRKEMQERMDARQKFVLHVVAPADKLGWLWQQAL